MKKRHYKYRPPIWFKSIRAFCAPFIIPFCVFEGIRLLLLPTLFDVLLFAILIIMAFTIYFDI